MKKHSARLLILLSATSLFVAYTTCSQTGFQTSSSLTMSSLGNNQGASTGNSAVIPMLRQHSDTTRIYFRV